MEVPVMISVRPVLREIPDPRGKKGRLHRLEAISGLILLSMPVGRKGMKAAFHPGRGLSRRSSARIPPEHTHRPRLRSVPGFRQNGLSKPVRAPPTNALVAGCNPSSRKTTTPPRKRQTATPSEPSVRYPESGKSFRRLLLHPTAETHGRASRQAPALELCEGSAPMPIACAAE